MPSERCQFLREGFLDVKFPPGSPERVLYKAWRQLWIRTSALYPAGRGEPHLILQLMRRPGDEQYQVLKTCRDGLRLFRCRSGSRPLKAWALSSISSVLIYLAAENEEETQSWMKNIRDGLWPPTSTRLDETYDVSLIDDERSFRSGIHGLYGRLTATLDGTMSIIHPHWQGILLRWKREDVTEIRLIRKVGGQTSKAGVFRITLSCMKNGQTLNFYSKTAESAIQYILSCSTDQENFESNRNIQNTTKLTKILPDENMVSSEGQSEYATIRKLSNRLVVDPTDKTYIELTQNENKSLPSDTLAVANISSELLNASISSTISAWKDPTEDNAQTTQIKEDNDSDDSLTDSYAHIYEEMAPRTASVGAYTLYEDIDDDDESEYVPPLPPPLPNHPIERPNSLRLLKLSESVVEALKTAGVVEQHKKVMKNVNDKTSKSLQASPMVETPSSKKQWDDSLLLQRRSSEPDIGKNIAMKLAFDKKETTAKQNSSKYLSPGKTLSRAILKMNEKGTVSTNESTEIS